MGGLWEKKNHVEKYTMNCLVFYVFIEDRLYKSILDNNVAGLNVTVNKS